MLQMHGGKITEKKKSFPCDWPGCSRAFTLNIFLQKHKQSHNKTNTPQTWLCSICGRRYKTPNALKQHKRGMHSKPQDHFKCNDCNMTFKWKQGLRKHKLLFKCKVFQLNPFEIDESTKGPGHLNKGTNKDKDGGNKGQSELDKESSKEIDSVNNGPTDKNSKTIEKSKKTTEPGNLSSLTDKAFSAIKTQNPQTCPECSRVLPSKTGLANHLRTYHPNVERPMEPVKKYVGKGVYTCEECGNTYSYSNGLKNHINKVHKGITLPWQRRKQAGKGVYQCEFCAACYSYREGLRVHIDKIHKGIRYPCTVCDKQYSTKGALTLHMKTAHCTETPYQCMRCGEQFKLRRQYKAHQERKIKCAPVFLGPRLQAPGSLRQDSTGTMGTGSLMGIQCKDDPYQIVSASLDNMASDTIGQQANYLIGQQQTNDLIGHNVGQLPGVPIGHLPSDATGQQGNNTTGQRLNYSPGQQAGNPIGPGHSAESSSGEEKVLVGKPKIYPCDLCSKSFTNKAGLRHHRQGIHLGEYKYRCSTCQKGFNTKNNLLDHERLHTDTPSFSCERCGKMIRQRSNYYAHRNRCMKKQKAKLQDATPM